MKIQKLKIRLNILHTTLFLGMGGLESIIMDIARYLDKDSFQVHILCLGRYDEKYKSELEAIGINVYHIKRKSRFDLSFFKQIISLLKGKQIDLLHAHSGCFFNSAICAWFARIPSVVYTEHGLQLLNDGTAINTSIQTKIEDNIAAVISDCMFAVSKEIKEDMANRFRFQHSKIKFISNGINTDLFKPGSKSKAVKLLKIPSLQPYKFIIGSVGRLVHVKNYSFLIRSFAALPSEILEKSHLVLIGDGTERSKLEKEAMQLDLQGKTTFLGVQYDIFNILPAFDLFVLPSFTEGTSISLLEAQSCGVPAVATNVGGNSTIIEDNVNGFLCESDDTEDMVKKINFILNDQKLANEMGINARKKVIEKFSLQYMIKIYEQTYQQLNQENNI